MHRLAGGPRSEAPLVLLRPAAGTLGLRPAQHDIQVARSLLRIRKHLHTGYIAAHRGKRELDRRTEDVAGDTPEPTVRPRDQGDHHAERDDGCDR